MSLVDLVACGSAAVASACLALRANMLKPMFSEWHSAPPPVWLSLMASSGTLAVLALWLLGPGNHVPFMATLALVAQAVSSAIMLVNLVRQTEAKRQIDGLAP